MAFYTIKQMGISQEEVIEICENLWQDVLADTGKCPDCGVDADQIDLL